MLQPLWESRDRYEELKQLDDAAKEVTRAAGEWPSSWHTPGAAVGGAPWTGAHFHSPKTRTLENQEIYTLHETKLP